MGGWSIRVRLTVLATVVMTLLCVLGCVLITVFNYEQAGVFRAEQIEASALKTVHLIKRGALTTVLADPGPPTTALQVVNARGEVVAGTGALGTQDRLSRLVPPKDDTTRDGTMCNVADTPGCLVVAVFRVYQGDGDWYAYAFGEPVPWYISVQFVGQLLTCSLLLILLTACGTALVVGRALSPVEQIRRDAAEIGDHVADRKAEGRRVPLPAHDDELRALTVTVNALLARMEESIQHERRFASDASHDMRSPITAMRMELDDAFDNPDDTDFEELAHRVAGSVDRLQRLVDDLLALTRLDAAAPAARERLDLAALVGAEITHREPDERVEVHAQHVLIDGSRSQLSRLVANLLNNACRHADRHIRIHIYRDGDDAVLDVDNDGDTIPAEQREAIFDRFTRLKDSQTKDKGGSGLGLAIVREIATAHHGTATATTSPLGTRLRIRLPRTTTPPPDEP
ncbi:hypothetical protein GCM10022221_64800 [Actinocorallia aurea]